MMCQKNGRTTIVRIETLYQVFLEAIELEIIYSREKLPYELFDGALEPEAKNKANFTE
jgi:hypothetical protein